MEVRSDPYESLAEYYDELHASLSVDIGMILSMAAHGAPVLELGCGTGRLLLPLARAGYDVVGVDRSLPMLRRAQRRIASEPAEVGQFVKLLCADMTTIAFTGAEFELALIPYNTLMHLASENAAIALRRIRHHLAPRGRLFIDVVNPLLVEQTDETQALSLERVFTDESSGDYVAVMAANELDAERQLLKITWLFDRSPRHGGQVSRSVVQVDYHYYFPHQVELMLQEAGLELVAMYGNYNEHPYSEESERLLVVAQRPY